MMFCQGYTSKDLRFVRGSFAVREGSFLSFLAHGCQMRYNKGIHDRKDGDDMSCCSSCSENIEAGAKFCPFCGARQVYCASCGAHLRAESRFCSMCGAMVLPSASENEDSRVTSEPSVSANEDSYSADEPSVFVDEDSYSADEPSVSECDEAEAVVMVSVTNTETDEQEAEVIEPIQDEVSPSIDDTQKIVLPPPAEMVREERYDDELPKKSWFQTNRRPLVIGAICVILVAILSSWFFSSQMREDEYQAKMTTLCENLTSIHTEVLRQTDMLDVSNRAQIGEQIKQRLEIVRKMKEEQADLRAPSSLKDENEKIAKIMVLEEQILSQAEVFCREPLATDPSAARQMLAEWTKKQNELLRAVRLDAEFAQIPSLDRAVSPIYAMMEKEKKLEEERLKQLAMRKTFLEKMDNIIKDYDGQKGAMTAVLEEARSGAISSSTYRVHVAQARAERESLRSRVHALEVPNDAQGLTARLDEALATSLYYCDLMDELANPLLSILQGRDVYGEARSVDAQVQSIYSAFLSEYEAYKNAGDASQTGERSEAPSAEQDAE